MTALSTVPREPLRVLEILGNAVVGGMEHYVMRFALALAADGIEVTCLCPFESSVTRALRQAGCRVFIAPITDDPRWSTLQLAVTLVRELGIGLMHAHLTNAHVLGALVSNITGVPCVATIHGRSIPIADLEVARVCRTHVTVVTEGAYWHALALGIPPERLHCIRNGVDTDIYRDLHQHKPLARELGIEPDCVLVGQVGRLAHEKGPEVFVRAAWLVHQTCPQIRFVFIGDGPMRMELQAQVAELKLDGIVHFAGVRADMPDIYPCLDILVSSSHSEGMPFAIMEAMACAVPAIATNVGGVAELVESDITGLLVAPGDHEAIARNIVQLAADPVRRQLMGADARKRVIAHFPAASSATRMKSLLSTLAQRPSDDLEAPAATGMRRMNGVDTKRQRISTLPSSQ